jgi:hypothetical protein
MEGPLIATAMAVADHLWTIIICRSSIMNNSTVKRSEEARRQAQAVLIEAKRRQEESLKERDSMRAGDVQKVESLRAQRLAKAEEVSNANSAIAKPAPAKRKRLPIAA